MRAKPRMTGARRATRTVVRVAVVAMVLLPVLPTKADELPVMFECTDAVTATPAERDAFADRWSDRLLNQDPDFDLQAYVDAAAAGESPPPEILAEVGFTPATRDTLTRGCLISVLADELTVRDPTFGMDTSTDPPTPFPPETVKAMLAMVVFGNQTEATLADKEHGPLIDLPDPVTDALDALGLDQLLDIDVPTLAIPTGLGIPTPISVLISDLVTLVQGIGLPQLPDLNGLIQLPGLPIELPTLPTLPSLTDLVNLIRSVIDATSYTVCYTGDKTNGEKCTTSVLGLPVLLDVQGDALPDLRAHLLPTVVPQYPTGISMQFSVDRMGLNPLATPPPVHADVTATWDIPAANARAHIGFLSRFKPGLTLSRSSVLTATVTNLSDASAGNPTIPFRITHQSPDVESQVVAGISKLLRNAQSGAVTVPEATIANLGFAPVPTTTTGSLAVQTTNAGANQVRYLANLNTNIATKLTMNLLRDYTAAEATAPCCPVQRFTAIADKLPTTLALDILKNDATDTWTVGYTGNATVGKLSVEGADYPTAAELAKPLDQQTMSAFSAAVTQVPTKVDVIAAIPGDGANPRAVDVVYKGSLASNPNAIVTVPTVDLGTVTRVAGDVQRSFAGHAEDVPGRMHVNATLAGDALNTPAGDNLDVDLLYDSSSVAKNLTVDFFDKGKTSTSKLSGTIATLPPWLNVNVGSHPGSKAVSFNAKSGPTAPDASAALGTVNLKYARNSEFLNLGATTPTTAQYAVVKTTNGADNQGDTDDDGTAIEARYTGLKRTVVSLQDDGLPKGNLDLHAKVVNDANRAMTARFDSPESNVDAVITDVPQDIDVTYQRRRTGSVDPVCGTPDNTHKVVYDAVGNIDRAVVRIEGKTAAGAVDPNNLVVVNAGRDPATNGEPIPKHLELFANSQTQKVAYRADGTVGQVAASILDAAPACGNKKGVNVDLRGVPTQFGASMDPEHLRFVDLADTTTPIDQVALSQSTPVAVALRSVAVAFTDNPTGAVPVLPTANQLAVASDKRGAGAISAAIRLGGVRMFKLDLNKANPTNPDSDIVGVVADLQLASALSGVATSLSFIGEDAQEARVGGALDVPADLHLELGLAEGDTQVHYDTPGGHMRVNLEIALGTTGMLDTVVLPGGQNSRPVGVTIRDSQHAKKIAVFLEGAPSSLDLAIDKITTNFRNPVEVPFLVFSDYAPPGGSSDLNVDVELRNSTDDANNPDPSKNLVVKVVLHGVPTGYGITVAPIATGAEGDDAPTYFDLLVKGTKPVGAVGVDVSAGVPETTDGSTPCSACKLHLTAELSNLPPGFQFHLDAGPSGDNAGRKVTNIDILQLGVDGNLDLTQTINNVKLGVLMWQLEPFSQNVRTAPQVKADINQVPSSIDISIADGGPKDESIAAPCARPDSVLPKLSFTADGANRDSMDLNAEIDFVMTSDDPKAVDPDAAVLKVGATDLSRSVKFENTADGKFIVSSADPTAPKSGKVHLEVSAQTLKIFNWSFLPRDNGGCGFSGTVGPVTISTEGGLAFNIRTGLVLDIEGLRSITLDPGVWIGVEGDFDKFTFGMRDPKLADLYVSGIGLRFKVRISDSIQPSIPIVYPPFSIGGPDNPVPPIPISIDFVDLSVNSRGNWIDVNLIVPCDIDVSWDDVDIDQFHAGVDTLPGLFAPNANGFTTTDDGTFLVMPFGEELSAGLRFFLDPIMIGLDQLFFGEGEFDAYIRCPD